MHSSTIDIDTHVLHKLQALALSVVAGQYPRCATIERHIYLHGRAAALSLRQFPCSLNVFYAQYSVRRTRKHTGVAQMGVFSTRTRFAYAHRHRHKYTQPCTATAASSQCVCSCVLCSTRRTVVAAALPGVRVCVSGRRRRKVQSVWANTYALLDIVRSASAAAASSIFVVVCEQ